MIVLNSMAAGDSTPRSRSRPRRPAPVTSALATPGASPARPQLPAPATGEGGARARASARSRRTRAAASGGWSSAAFSSSPRAAGYARSNRRNGSRSSSGAGRLGRDVPRQEAQEVTRRVPRDEEARREELAARGAPGRRRGGFRGAAREPAVVGGGVDGLRRRPPPSAPPRRRGRGGPRSGSRAPRGAPSRSKTANSRRWPSSRKTLRPCAVSRCDEDDPVRVRKPGEVRRSASCAPASVTRRSRGRRRRRAAVPVRAIEPRATRPTTRLSASSAARRRSVKRL